MRQDSYADGSEKVIESVGFWPSFHDAEVISFSVERALPLKLGATLARLAIHYREYAEVGAGTAEYELALSKSLLINFIFIGVSDIQLSEFNHQNVINSLTFKKIDTENGGSLQACVESIWGFGGVLQCDAIAVESVTAM